MPSLAKSTPKGIRQPEPTRKPNAQPKPNAVAGATTSTSLAKSPANPAIPATPPDHIDSLEPAAMEALVQPVGFMMGILRLPLYPWQAAFCSGCEEIGERRKLSLVAPNGSGKSAVIIAGLALWWLAVHRRGRVVITTRDARQLDNQIEPAIQRHQDKLDGWKFIRRRVENPTGGFAVLFTTDEPGRAEGWHQGFLGDGGPDPEAPLLMICDEAKSVPENIFEAIDRCTYNVLVYVSSPGLKSGRFYESQSQQARALGFRAMKAGLADCPHIPRERIDDIIATYGADHPFTLSTLHGEFMDEDSETMFIIPPSAVRGVVEGPPQFADGRQLAFFDFAAGGDECVAAFKRGNRVELVAWKEPNTMASVGRFIIEATRRGLRPGEVHGDEGGLGGPMIDRLAEAGWPINRVNNGAAALNPERYYNRGAEIWHTAGLVMQGYGCILPADEKLYNQLTTRKMKPMSDGRIAIEKKEEMKKRGLGSPDRADAVAGVLAIEAGMTAGAFAFDGAGLRRLEAGVRVPQPGVLAPADFGVNWRDESDESEGWLQVWEAPVHGRAYLACLKAGGGDRAGGDGWSVFVLRKACVDEKATQLRDAVVARIRPPCHWDASLLAQRLDLLLKWYGGPVIVPDVRNGLDMLERLRDIGAGIYRRPSFDRAQPAAGQAFHYGWETNEKNVAVALSALTRAVREQTLDVPDAVAVNALRAYVRGDLDAGDVLALGIGLQCFDAAMVYAPPAFAVPPHFAMGDERAGLGGLGGACK